MTLDELKRFCAKNDIRGYLEQPWSRGDYTYASNGHICVRIPLLADIPANDKAPDIDALFLKNPPGPEWVSVPVLSAPADIECRYCYGTGEAECPTCSNCGPCDNCNATGKVQDTSGMAFSGTFFTTRYLALIQGWEIAPNGQNPAWIRNGDALGLLMPRSCI